MLDVYAKQPPTVTPCQSGTPGYSFYFDLILRLWNGCTAEGAIHRLCSLVRKMGAATLLEEELEPNQEILQEFEDVEARLGEKLPVTPKAVRLSFFAAPCQNQDWQSLPEDSFLGYAVVVLLQFPLNNAILKKPDPTPSVAYVLEAVTRPPCRITKDPSGAISAHGVTNYYVHCHRTFETTIGTQKDHRKCSVIGTFFCQQNGLTHVCAHAALRMILNTAKGLVDHKVTSRELNTILNIDHKTLTVGDGLRPDQIRSIGNHFGLNMIAGDFLANPTVDYAEFIYPFVESGYPAFLAFNPTHAVGHVVTVIGHTMNSDKWDCEAHLAYRPEATIFGFYHASAAWVDHFILNDDNFGMYSCMPPGYLRNKTLPQYDMTQRATFAFAFLPKNVQVMPYLAEKIAVALVRRLHEHFTPPAASPNRWLTRLWEQIKSGSRRGIVARTVLCDKAQYLDAMKDKQDSDGSVQKNWNVLASAPDMFWLTELSLPDLYTANKHKIGDVLSDVAPAVVDGQQLVKFIWGWLPGIQIPADPKPGVVPSAWPLTGHVPFLRLPSVFGPHDEW
jgi:hypothetical protein